MQTLNELLRLSASGDLQAADRLRGELNSCLTLLVRRKSRTPAGRLDLATWLGVSPRSAIPSPLESGRVDLLVEQLLEALVKRRGEVAHAAAAVASPEWRTARRAQHAFETVEV